MNDRIQPDDKTQTAAVFAGGCFWGIEHLFSRVAGVAGVESGYTGGHVADPTYEQVCTDRTGHAEAVRVTYDPDRISYEQLARLFFEFHDPTQLNRQGPDIGNRYRSAVFYADDEEKRTVEHLIGLLRERGYNVVTTLEPLGRFYPAEEYHQHYIDRHPGRGCHLPVHRFERKVS